MTVEVGGATAKRGLLGCRLRSAPHGFAVFGDFVAGAGEHDVVAGAYRRYVNARVHIAINLVVARCGWATVRQAGGSPTISATRLV